MLRPASYQIVSEKFIDFSPLNSFYFGASEPVVFSEVDILITWFHYNKISEENNFFKKLILKYVKFKLFSNEGEGGEIAYIYIMNGRSYFF